MTDIIIEQGDITDSAILQDIISVGIDSTITDPPYAPRVHSKAMSNGTAGSEPKKRDLGFGPLTLAAREAVAAIVAETAGWSLVFSDLESGHLWRDAVSAEYIRSVPWVRWSQPQLSGDRPPSGAELITIWHRAGAKRWNGPGSLTAFATQDVSLAGVLDAKSLRGADKYSCEKPLDLMLQLVSWFSDVGGVVCDPMCGAGTTGQACRVLGRHAILVDASGDACEVARNRVKSDLTDRDRERVKRFVDFQEGWLSGDVPQTEAGARRYAAAKEDTERAGQWLTDGS